MEVAIVILNWNGAELLKAYLPEVIAHSPKASIYVIDNASPDGSVELIRTRFPQVSCIENTDNLGFAGGYNAGLRKIKADEFCLLNSDVKVSEGWLTPIVSQFETDSKAAIVQPKILDLKNPGHFEYAGAGGGFLDKLGYPFCRGRIFQVLEEDLGQYDDITEVFWATGACMFIRTKVFWDLGGFDTRYFAHQEEIDLCWRAQNKGFRVFYNGFSKVYHLGGSTLSNSNPNKTYLNFRNSLYSITKNLPRRSAFKLIFYRLILDGVAAVWFLFQLRPMHSLAILRAHLVFYLNFRKLYKSREKANFLLKYYRTKSIVWSHFVHQVKNFNNLVKD